MASLIRLSTFTVLVVLFCTGAALAEVRTESVEYEVDGEPFVGYLAYDDAVEGERPGVLVVHEWWGLDDYARRRAEELAELGYTAFALNMYGKGKLAEHPEDAQAFMQATLGDRRAMEARFAAGLSILQAHATTDPERIAAQGYCFGGAVVLNMARLGLDLDGVVSFHGSLGSDIEAEPGSVEAKVLAFTGGADPFVPAEQVAGFVEEMQTAQAELRLVSYPGVQHSFTVPDADETGAKFDLPMAYDRRADRHSWRTTAAFYREIFTGD
ncbi:dienelactone hydrolase family protein [Spiribacter halobius]|uniref:Dienelactone hydrolase n=1 Tax=Sediminicurvatus halobius TaxID=2182432 RepID=A0A2U2N1D2_9GAMM|nr:dienelactone hydrolase family protein [Spiribacter halobius]PWG63006.1 dienelactone hydrolase [Spiribacter halobius]UEX77466.1 dienelactone hydrolase family protein [Spiribacter halobius]